jgi:glycosyltransferase involved in cell wall biosynthesis
VRILALTHDLPTPHFSDMIPAFHFLKNLSRLYGHQITLVSFASERNRTEDIYRVAQFCSIGGVFQIGRRFPEYLKALHLIKNTLIHNLDSGFKSGIDVTDYYYSSSMALRVAALLQGGYDLIYLTWPMGYYVSNTSIPTVLHLFDVLSDWYRQIAVRQSGINKFILLSGVRFFEKYERGISRFSVCVTPTSRDKFLLRHSSPAANIEVVPLGVDVDAFKPERSKENYPSLTYVSDMSGLVSAINIHFFYRKVFPMIKDAFPTVKLLLVGRNPRKEISKLAGDPSVIVTGNVESVIPYLAMTSVFIAPVVVGTGMKNKVLEAMAMGKCIVSTTEGIQGLEVVSGKHLLISDQPDVFAQHVIELLQDKRKREFLGNNARLLVAQAYSWESLTRKLNGILEKRHW